MVRDAEKRKKSMRSLSCLLLLFLLQFCDARSLKTVSKTRCASIAATLSPYKSFTAIYPANTVASYLCGLKNGTFLVPNAFAVRVFNETLKKAGKNVNDVRYNLLRYLTLGYRQSKDDFLVSAGKTCVAFVLIFLLSFDPSEREVIVFICISFSSYVLYSLISLYLQCLRNC